VAHTRPPEPEHTRRVINDKKSNARLNVKHVFLSIFLIKCWSRSSFKGLSSKLETLINKTAKEKPNIETLERDM
jgi:hypothetical protein